MLRIFFQITIFPLVFEISAETKRLDFCNRFLFITIEIFISPGSHKLLVVILRRMTTNFKNFPGIFLNMNNIVSSISQLFWSNVMSSFWVHISLQVLLCNCRNRHVSLTSREYLCTKLFLFFHCKNLHGHGLDFTPNTAILLIHKATESIKQNFTVKMKN